MCLPASVESNNDTTCQPRLVTASCEMVSVWPEWLHRHHSNLHPRYHILQRVHVSQQLPGSHLPLCSLLACRGIVIPETCSVRALYSYLGAPSSALLEGMRCSALRVSVTLILCDGFAVPCRCA